MVGDREGIGMTLCAGMAAKARLHAVIDGRISLPIIFYSLRR